MDKKNQGGKKTEIEIVCASAYRSDQLDPTTIIIKETKCLTALISLKPAN